MLYWSVQTEEMDGSLLSYEEIVTSLYALIQLSVCSKSAVKWREQLILVDEVTVFVQVSACNFHVYVYCIVYTFIL
jgi:hypothetical protein